MSEENNPDQEVNSSENAPNSNESSSDNSDKDLIEKLVKERLENSLKDIKEKLNKAYGARDEAFKKVAEFEQKEREAELKRLKEEGKFKEAYEMQLAEEKARREALEKKNIELTRDIDVRNSLTTLDFRNDNAAEMAYKEIVGQLVRNDDGVWVHRSGIAIRDYVKAFAESEDNSFLFKQKVSSGSGSSSTKNSSSSKVDSKKSLFSLSQEEVLKLASEGKLRR